MKLSEFKDEEAIEVLADILEPTSEIMTDKEIVKMFSAKDAKVLQVAQKILAGHSKAVMRIMSGLNRGEYHCTIPSLLKDLVDVIGDEDLWNFFRSQGQMMEFTSSTSASENTEVHAK